jgi:hypothetical protein
MQNKMQNMKLKIMRLRTFLYLASAVILLAGLISSVLIYRAAINDSTSDSSYEIVGGYIYPGGGGYTKKYVHDLQLYGGNAAVLTDEFMRWFTGLWHGKSLSFTVASIAFILSLGVIVIANNVQPSSRSDIPREDNGDENA